MSIVSFIRKSLLRSRFSRTLAEKLIADSARFHNKVLPNNTARQKLKRAKRYSSGYRGNNKWKFWGWLIRNHQRAHEQKSQLEAALPLVTRATKAEKKGEFSGSERQRFVSGFSALVDEGDGLEDLEEKISRGVHDWSTLADQIEKIRPRVFLTHVFLILSRTSGIEIASLVVGGLFVLGALFMAFFYETAVMLSPVAYWTLNDFILHGILVIPVVVVLVAIFELIVFYFLGRIVGYRLHGWVLNHPAYIAIFFFIVAATVTTLVGYERGKDKFNAFTHLSQDSSEMATVLDRSVLRDVFLVGATDRTAIFWQVTDWTEFSTIRDQIPLVPYWKAARCVFSAFWAGNVCPTRQNKKYSLDDKPYKSFVMDRALVVCHGRLGVCTLPDNLSSLEDPNENEDVERILGAMNDSIGALRSEMTENFEDVDEHMDRHYGNVMDHLRSLGPVTDSIMGQ